MAHCVGRNRVGIVAERIWLRSWRAWPEFLGLKAGQKSGDDVPRKSIDRTIPENWRPCFMIPGNNIPQRVQASAFIDRKCEAVIFPCHFVFARELNAHRFSDRL